MPKYKYLRDKDLWMLAEDIPDIDFFFSQIWLSAFVNQLTNACGRNYKKDLAVWNKYDIKFYFGDKDSLKFEQHLVKKIFATPKFGADINKNIIKWSNALTDYCKRLSKRNLKKLSNADLLALLDEQDNIHTRLYEWGWLSNATDMFHGGFTTALQEYIAPRAKKAYLDFNNTFNILTTPNNKSVDAIQEESLLKIAAGVASNKKINKKAEEKLSKHHSKYSHQRSLWIGKYSAYPISYYRKQVVEMVDNPVTPATRLRMANEELAKNKLEKAKLLRQLKINAKHRAILNIYSDFMLTKIYRRYAQLYWAYEMRALLKKIAKRLKLTIDDVRFMLPEEFKCGLTEGNIDRREIKKRTRFCWYYAEKGKDLLSTDRKATILKKLKERTTESVTEFTGQIACLGKVKGNIKIINTPSDMAKMKKGDILVSIATNPDIVPAMKKASAIITEQGGITSHAAIVSRELNTPCVIGTKIATRALKDGDRVEVDANKGVIRKI